MPKRSATRLTVQALAKFRTPRVGRIEHHDSEVPGLAYRISSTGARSWTFRYRYGGKPRRMTLGKAEALDLKAARDLARDKYEILRRGKDPAEEQRVHRVETARQAANTFGKAIDRYIREHVRGPKHYDGAKGALPRQRTWKETEQIINRYLRPKWGNRPLSGITKADVLSVTDPIAIEAPYMANRVHGLVRAFFNWALEKDLVDASPAHRMKKPHKAEPRNRPLSEREIRAFWDACIEEGGQFGAAYRLLLVTGARRDEVCELPKAELDAGPDAATNWVLPPARSKSKRRHVVPLTDLAREILREAPNHTGPFVFSTTFGERPISGHSKAIARIKQRGNALLAKSKGGGDISDIRLHDLRETMATAMREHLSVTSDVISQVLNHAPSGVTQRHYASRASEADKLAALEKWDRYLQALIGREAGKVVKFPRAR